MRVLTGHRVAAMTFGSALFFLAQFGAAQSEPARRVSPVHRQPYTAEFKITSVQTLANGTTITRESTEVHALDSQGRQMTATTQVPVMSDQPPVTRVHVYDPVENIRTDWDSRRKRATVVKEPARDDRHGCWANDSGNFRMNFGPAPGGPGTASSSFASTSNDTGEGPAVNGPAHPIEHRKQVREDLGTTTILGVEARGTRTTWTTPAGELGNDAPLVRTSETWWGTGIGLLLREISDDPRSGKHDREPVNIELAEPPASTFQPPDGYEVVVEEMHPVDCKQQ